MRGFRESKDGNRESSFCSFSFFDKSIKMHDDVFVSGLEYLSVKDVCIAIKRQSNAYLCTRIVFLVLLISH